MYITRIESGQGKRYKVFGNDRFLFSLYEKEIKHYHIVEGTEIEEAVIDFIRQKIILNRSRERALYLLERKPYTVSMMKRKLLDNDYPEEIIEQVIQFLEQYHYLDDKEYVHMYVNHYANTKSRKQIIFDLLRKGVFKDIIDEYFEDVEYSEEECCKIQFERYVRGKDLSDQLVRQKVFRYLYGKGFSASIIKESLRQYTLE